MILDERFSGPLVGASIGLLFAVLLFAAFSGPSPCEHSVHAFSYFAKCKHPNHRATLTNEYGPLLLVCECPAEVAP